MKRLRLVLIAHLAIGCLNQNAAAQSCEDNVAAARPAVVELLVSGPNASNTSTNNIAGSGFIVHSAALKTFIFTAAHILNPETGWADKPVGSGWDRTIRVRWQKENRQFVTLADDAKVIDENKEQDFAILEIPEQPVMPIRLASSSRIKTAASVCIAGFPDVEHDYIGKIRSVRSVDLANYRITLEGTAEGGQSGGPIMDDTGRVIAIINENDSKQAPKNHKAVIVSAPLDVLNDKLRKMGAATASLADSGAATARIQILERKMSAAGEVRGDSGDLQAGKRAHITSETKAEVSLQGVGSEQSDCLPNSYSWSSSGSATSVVQPFELTGVRMLLQTTVAGGRYTKATACVEKNPVGLVPFDTRASANATGEATILFETSGPIPFDLRVIWRQLPDASELVVINPLSQIAADIDPSGGPEKDVRINIAGKWQVKVRAPLDANAVGIGRALASVRPLVLLEAR